MLRAAAACGTGAEQGAGNGWPLLLIVLLGGCCWGWLYRVALDYPRIDKGPQRTIGMGLQLIAGVSVASAATILLIELRTKCGADVGPAATAARWLFLLAVASFMASVLLLRPRAGWVAGATVIIIDIMLALSAVVEPPHSGQAAAIMLFAVHACCTMVANWWARQLRASPDPLPAKAAEASRILCASWIVVGLLLIADSHDDQLLSNSTARQPIRCHRGQRDSRLGLHPVRRGPGPRGGVCTGAGRPHQADAWTRPRDRAVRPVAGCTS